MPSPENRFERLVRLSRRAPDDTPDGAMPPALATRVIAQLRPVDREPISAWEWLSLRAVPLAAVAAAVCVFLGDDTWPNRPVDEERLTQAIIQDQLAP